MRRAVRRTWLVTTALALALPSMAQAQTAQQTPSPSGDDASTTTQGDIIVTANKRQERIQDVSLSITAVSGEELARNQVQDTQDLAQRVPGFSFQRAGSIGGNGNQIILRGLNTGGNGATVATAVDDAPLSFSSSISRGSQFATDFEPYDLQRIEVLRGPQGSLYGATAEGGLIKYVTTPPDLTRFGAGFSAGGFDLRRGGGGADANVYVNAPIADDVAGLRVGGYYHYSPGWISNNLNRDPHANSFVRYGGRASLLVKAGERLTLRGTAIYQKLDQDGFDAVEVNGLTQPNNQFGLLHGYNLDTFLPQPSRTKGQLYIGNVTYDAGPLAVQSITSYGRLDNFLTNDVPLYGQVFGGMLFGRPNTTLFFETQNNLKKFNQEVRLYSTNQAAQQGHGLQWQIGAFYTNERNTLSANYFTRDTQTGQNVATPTFGADPLVLQTNQAQKYREIAGYVDLTYFFSPRFDIEAGGRVFHNTQSQGTIQGGTFLGQPLGTVQPDVGSRETDFTFAVSPRFHLNRNAIIYARAASGYRPGGPQTYIANAPATLPRQYTSDSTINYEVGLKGTFLNRALTVDVAGFYIDWTDVQINVAVPVNQGQANGVSYTIVANAGKAVSKGVEWTINLVPVRGLTLTALGAYTDARLTRDAPGIGGFKNDRLPYVPEVAYTFSTNYEFPLGGDLKASIGGSYSHTGNRYSTYTLTPALSHLRFPGYDTVSAQLGVRSGPIGIELYGKNLSDERGITFYYAGQAALGGAIPAQVGLIRPREVGIRLTGAF